MGRGTGKFVWPPRAVGVAPDAPAAGGPSNGAVGVVGGEPPADGSVSVDLRPPPRPRSVVSEIERVWLGRTRAPLAERMAEAGWSADSRTAYCPRCASSAGPYAADDTGCAWCRGPAGVPWERAVRLGDYAGVLREMVLEVKFTRWRRLGDQLGRLLGEAVAAELSLVGVNRDRAVLVPVPMSLRRWLFTGIDHSLVICRGVAAATELPIVRALSRKHRPSQRAVAPSKRVANVARAFGVRRSMARPEEGWTAVVVDDVRTTGATMAAACRVLGKAWPGVRLWSAVLGVTPGGDGPNERAKGDRDSSRIGAGS
jgi:predicted amidophosphoribosyltransferase